VKEPLCYFDSLEAAALLVKQVLLSKGVAASKLSFGGIGENSKKRPYVPVDANSNFLGNRALGDWAESTLADLVDDGVEGFVPTQYGDSNEIAAGDAGFKEYYLGQLEATRVFGKRPDLLVYPKDACPDRGFFSGVSVSESEEVSKSASVAVEVRSSKFKALKYMRVRADEKIAGKKVDRDCPSFTVKVEDLIIVYRWMERFRVPQIYAQVFLDSIFAINFLDIFKIIGSGLDFKIEKPKQSQEKATIMIPITRGRQIATCIDPPGFRTEIRETRLGRIDAFVAPTGGKFELDASAFASVAFR
jgi:hypothetical protein